MMSALGLLMTGSSPKKAPTFASVAPTWGDAAGGEDVVITGTNFRAGATVTIGGVAATSVSVVSSTQITCTSPVTTAGAKNVVVTQGSRSATGAGAYTAKTNLILSPNDISDAYWAALNLSARTATRMTDTNDTGTPRIHRVMRTPIAGLSTGAAATYVMYVKNGTIGGIRFSDEVSNVQTVNAITGAQVDSSGGTQTRVPGTGAWSGWWKWTITTNSVGGSYLSLYLYNLASNHNYPGDGTGNAYVSWIRCFQP
jgi:hypothetical protein